MTGPPDRASGGPGGRQSARRRIVVASYNVHRCIGGDGRYDPDRVANVLRELDADILSLQEVSMRKPGEGIDQASYLAESLGYTAFDGVTCTHGPTTVGNALLTRLPIRRAQCLDISVRRNEPRGAILAHLDADGIALLVVVTHLGLRRSERRLQIERLVSSFDDAEVVVLAGDLNEWRAGGPVNRRLALALGRAPAVRTFPARRPLFCLDRVITRPAAILHTFAAHATPTARWASDHLPVVSEIDLTQSETDSRRGVENAESRMEF